MFFGQTYIEESKKKDWADDGIGTTANMIAHMVKYESDKQKHKQSSSWSKTILNNYDRLISNEESVGKGKMNYISAIKKEDNGKILSGVNTRLKKDNTGLKIDEIPDKFSYENLTNKDFIAKFLLDNMHNSEIADSLESNGIKVPKKVLDKCDR